MQIAQGMQHAVRKVAGLVHRDLKPANIMVEGQGRAMVTDFGLVYAAQSDAGTPAYMAPEQWRKEGLDQRSDIYAYGCILYEMLTAHRVFPAVESGEWEAAHLKAKPVRPIDLNPAISAELDLFVLRCLAKAPDDRPRDWDEVVEFMVSCFQGITGQAVVLDFSPYQLAAHELCSAGNSLGSLDHKEEGLVCYDRALALDPSAMTQT
jgi:serine/threonine protein kinase